MQIKDYISSILFQSNKNENQQNKEEEQFSIGWKQKNQNQKRMIIKKATLNSMVIENDM